MVDAVELLMVFHFLGFQRTELEPFSYNSQVVAGTRGSMSYTPGAPGFRIQLQDEVDSSFIHYPLFLKRIMQALVPCHYAAGAHLFLARAPEMQ
jgi:hypothetical protein